MSQQTNAYVIPFTNEFETSVYNSFKRPPRGVSHPPVLKSLKQRMGEIKKEIKKANETLPQPTNGYDVRRVHVQSEKNHALIQDNTMHFTHDTVAAQLAKRPVHIKTPKAKHSHRFNYAAMYQENIKNGLAMSRMNARPHATPRTSHAEMRKMLNNTIQRSFEYNSLFNTALELYKVLFEFNYGNSIECIYKYRVDDACKRHPKENQTGFSKYQVDEQNKANHFYEKYADAFRKEKLYLLQHNILDRTHISNLTLYDIEANFAAINWKLQNSHIVNLITKHLRQYIIDQINHLKHVVIPTWIKDDIYLIKLSYTLSDTDEKALINQLHIQKMTTFSHSLLILKNAEDRIKHNVAKQQHEIEKENKEAGL